MTGGPVPVALRVHLAHATVQAVADACGAQLLHIKGPATDPSLRPGSGGVDEGGAPLHPPRASTDADVLVRPDEVTRFVRALTEHGWRILASFRTGSAFEHAATLWHDELGFVDVHRHFPGIERDPWDAFDLMWRSRHSVEIAHRACSVPSVEHQRLLLLLHAARTGGPTSPMAQALWAEAAEPVRQNVRQVAGLMHAEVALAAATGDLDDFAEHPSYALWRAYSTGDKVDRLTEWRARLLAAPTLLARLGLLGRALLVNRDHLAMSLLREPTTAEVAAEYLHRIRRGASELWGLAVGRLRGRR